MTIEDKGLVKAGTVLVGTYRQISHRVDVSQGEGDKLIYKLDGDKDYGSPSSASSAVMGGVASNGWRFWDIEGTEKPPKAPRVKAEKAPKEPKASKAAKVKKSNGGVETVGIFHTVKDQAGAGEGQTLWYCDNCADGFILPAGVTPTECINGHTNAGTPSTGDSAGLAESEDGIVNAERETAIV